MPLSHRPAVPQDLDACWRIVRGDCFYPPALREARTAFWQRMIAEEAVLSVVVEDSERSPETRLRSFSLSAFVTDAFAADAKAALPPGIAGHLHAQTLTDASPILGYSGIGRASARGGLTLAANPFGYAGEASERAMREVTEMMFSCLLNYHAGYQIKEVLFEAYGQEWTFKNVTAGLKIRTDYAGRFQGFPTQPGFDLPPDQQPALLGLTRDEAFASLGNRCFPLFLFTRPQFHFRRSEQRLLGHALRGGTNAESAQALNISLSAVKKCWEAIYMRVIQIDPELLSSRLDEIAPGKIRGLEKKDRLLAYLRQHPEELRPYLP